MTSLSAVGNFSSKMATLQRPQAAARSGPTTSSAGRVHLRTLTPAGTGARPALTGSNVRQRNPFLGGAALAARPAAVTTQGRRQVAVAASWGRGNGSPEIPDRIVAALPYLVSRSCNVQALHVLGCHQMQAWATGGLKVSAASLANSLLLLVSSPPPLPPPTST